METLVDTLEEALSSEEHPNQLGPPRKMPDSVFPEMNLESDASEIKEIELPFPAYFRARGAKYYIERSNGRWLSQNSSQLKRRLKSAGFTSGLDQDAVIMKFEDDFDVTYAAPLAGKCAGFYEENGIRFLVTESPKLIDPVMGDWPNLKKVIEGLLVDGEPDHGKTQWHTFLGWLKSSVDALRAGRHQNAQVLAIAGKKDCGKSLLQGLITDMLGGRSAKACRYMAGKTEFNSELFEAEHLILEDDLMGSSKGERDKLGSAFKNFAVSSRVSNCHGKGVAAINLPAFWRVTITLNDEPKALKVLPPLEESIEDKVILLRASWFEMPLPTSDGESQALFRETLLGELPAFLYWLMNVYEIPSEFKDRRFLVKTWHHPAIREVLDSLSPEAELLTLIDDILWDARTWKSWQGSAANLRKLLINDSRTARKAEKLLEWGNATGTLLGKAARWKPHRIKEKRTAKKRMWEIFRPDGED